MSLFDVIKYQISDAPTAEELAALPAEIYKQWLIDASWIHLYSVNPPTPAYLERYYGAIQHPADIVGRDHDISILRKIIRYYDEQRT